MSFLFVSAAAFPGLDLPRSIEKQLTRVCRRPVNRGRYRGCIRNISVLNNLTFWLRGLVQGGLFFHRRLAWLLLNRKRCWVVMCQMAQQGSSLVLGGCNCSHFHTFEGSIIHAAGGSSTLGE